VKLSPGKAILPGRKQIYRVERDGAADHDVLARHDEPPCGRALLRQVMKDGARLPAGTMTLDEICRQKQLEFDRLPASVRSVQPARYRVEVSDRLAEELELLKSGKNW